MITVLVVSPEGAGSTLGQRNPSIEVLLAGGTEEALEKLGRNRRVDAVLLLTPDAAMISEVIYEENPAPPPLYAPAPAPARVRELPAGAPEELLERLLQDLSASPGD